MKNSKYSQILDSLIGDQIPQNLNLAPKIHTKIHGQKGAMMNKRKRILIPTAVVLMMLTVVAFTVPAVADTIQRWIGYIPGFGQVQEEKLRTLDEPQTQSVDGVTISVNEVIASKDKTLVKYSILGIEDSMMSQGLVCPMTNSIPINSSPVISLSDGTVLRDESLGVSPGSGSYQFEATYSAIPQSENKVSLTLECLWQSGNGSSLWSFQVPLQLTDKGNAALMVAPVVVIPTEIAQNAAEEAGAQSSPSEMVVSQVIPLDNGYILQGTLTIEPESGLTVNIFNGLLEDVTVRDANNVTLTPEMVPGDFIVELNEEGSNKYNWAMLLNSPSIAWPLTITVNSISALTDPYAPSTFQVFVGENPQPGQEWVIEKDVPFGPKLVHVVSIKRIQNDFGMNGYEITFIYDSSLSFSYDIAGGVPNGGGGGGGGVNGALSTIVESYMGVVPTGNLSVQLYGQGVESIQGPWQVILAEPVY